MITKVQALEAFRLAVDTHIPLPSKPEGLPTPFELTIWQVTHEHVMNLRDHLISDFYDALEKYDGNH